MSNRLESLAPPEIFYNDTEAHIASEQEVEGDLLLSVMGQGSAIQPGVIGGAISISSFQWLSNAVKSSHQPRLRLKDFFRSLYRCLARGARAVFHAYPKNLAQRELILRSAMHAGFAGGVVVNYDIVPKTERNTLYSPVVLHH